MDTPSKSGLPKAVASRPKTQEEKDELLSVEHQVLSQWNRPWEKLISQMAKDLPRYAAIITFTDEHAKETPKMELKELILFLAEKFDKQCHTRAIEAFKTWRECADAQLGIEILLEKILEKDSPLSFILRCCTQGHFAPCSVTLMAGLEMSQLFSNTSHAIQIASVSPSELRVVHQREETATWGTVSWRVVTYYDFNRPSDPSVDFHVYDLNIRSADPNLTKLLAEKMHPFFSCGLQGKETAVVSAIDHQFVEIGPQILDVYPIKIMYLDSNFISSVPPLMIRYKDCLTELTLTNNKLPSFPDVVCKLVLLQKLSMGGNLIPSIPSDIKNLTALEELHLSKNRIAAIPKEITSLQKLFKLSLAGNVLQDVSNLKSLPKLTYLTLFGNPLPDQHTGSMGALTTAEEIKRFFG